MQWELRRLAGESGVLEGVLDLRVMGRLNGQRQKWGGDEERRVGG